mmetsp:Transcript_44783/g.114064  ORF Transcript_44783/g.114064 Transcript_44783/m.114064 type:complete len:319 (-) Transcript_44783:562-1518(-)
MLTSPPASMAVSAVRKSFWPTAVSSKVPYFLGRSRSSIRSRSSLPPFAGSCGAGSPDSFSFQFFKGRVSAVSVASPAATMSAAVRPNESSSAASAPLSNNSLTSSLLPAFAAAISGVCPDASLRLRSALPSTIICSNSFEPLTTQQWTGYKPVSGCGQSTVSSSNLAKALMMSPASMALQSSAARSCARRSWVAPAYSSFFFRALSMATPTDVSARVPSSPLVPTSSSIPCSYLLRCGARPPLAASLSETSGLSTWWTDFLPMKGTLARGGSAPEPRAWVAADAPAASLRVPGGPREDEEDDAGTAKGGSRGAGSGLL